MYAAWRGRIFVGIEAVDVDGFHLYDFLLNEMLEM